MQKKIHEYKFRHFSMMSSISSTFLIHSIGMFWIPNFAPRHATVLKTVRKPKLSYYAHGVRQTQLHLDSIVICFITIPIFHNFKLSEASWNLEVQKWWKTVLKIHFLKLYIFWSGSAGKLWLGPGCLLGKAQSKSLKGLAGTWGINHNSWLNFRM